jgi:hypothetical protein
MVLQQEEVKHFDQLEKLSFSFVLTEHFDQPEK